LNFIRFVNILFIFSHRTFMFCFDLCMCNVNRNQCVQ
jgi:hypothetical protein